MNAPYSVARRENRSKTRRKAHCRTAWGQVERVTLTDVSRQGCGLTLDRVVLQIRDFVIIRAEGLLGASGSVRWVQGNQLGVEFDAPLSSRVMACLTRPGVAATLIAPSTRTASTQLHS